MVEGIFPHRHLLPDDFYPPWDVIEANKRRVVLSDDDVMYTPPSMWFFDLISIGLFYSIVTWVGYKQRCGHLRAWRAQGNTVRGSVDRFVRKGPTQ